MGRQTLVPLVRRLVSLAGPSPSGSTGTPQRCQGHLPPSRASLGDDCPQLHQPVATGWRRGPLTPARWCGGASWRTSAYFQSSRARTASAACRSARFSIACNTHTPADPAACPDRPPHRTSPRTRHHRTPARARPEAVSHACPSDTRPAPQPPSRPESASTPITPLAKPETPDDHVITQTQRVSQQSLCRGPAVSQN
jgi:hypothetical protein